MKTETDPVAEPRATVVDDRLRYADRNRRRRRRRPGLPRRRTFEPLPLFSLASWSATDFLTLGLGVPARRLITDLEISASMILCAAR